MPLLTKPSFLSNDPWVNQGEKFAPFLTLPDGRIFAPVQKRNDVSAESIIGRAGVTAVMNYNSPTNVQHQFRHSSDFQQIIGYPDNTAHLVDRKTMRDLASYQLFCVEGNDFGEGRFAFAPDSDQAKWYYQRRAEIVSDPQYNPFGMKRRDYGHHGCTIAYQGLNNGLFLHSSGSPISPTNPFFRDAYKSVADARAGIGYFNTSIDGQRYEDLVGCNIKFYAETTDYAAAFFSKFYAIERMGMGMGKKGGLGTGLLVYNDWSKIEGINPGANMTINAGIQYHRRTQAPAGTVRTDGHAQINYDFQVGMALILGFLFSDGYTVFDEATRFGTNPNKMAPLNIPGPGNDNATGIYWDADVPGTPAPAEREGYPTVPNKWMDAGYEAASYYAQFNRTAGEQWKPCPFRFAGSEQWIEAPSDGAYILERAAAFDGVNNTGSGARRGGPVAFARTKGSAMDFVGFDSSRGSMYSEDILFRAPNGQQFPATLRGCTPAPHSETINN